MKYINDKSALMLIALTLGGCGSDSSEEPIDTTDIVDIIETPVNNAPTVTSTALVTSTVALAYSYSITANDSDDDTITLSASTLADWLTFDVDTGALTGTPEESDIGSHDVTLLVSDGSDEVTQNFTITVVAADIEPVNSAPTIKSAALLTSTVALTYSYTLTATDSDDDEITLSATTSPDWLTFDVSTGLLTGTPQDSDIGAHEIALLVSDGTDEVSQNFTITVQAAADEVVLPVIEQFRIVSSSQTSDVNLEQTEINEWSTGTEIVSDITFDNLTSWQLTSGANSAEAGNWGTALAFAGGIDGDFSPYTTLKVKMATTAGYESYAIAVTANGVNSEITLPVDSSITTWQDINLDLADFALNLSSIEQIAVFGVGGTANTSKIYIAELTLHADKAITVDAELENDFVFFSSDENIISDLIIDDNDQSAEGNIIFGEWSTGTIISDTTYEGLTAVELSAAGGWGAVLALQGDISDGTNIDNYDVDLNQYTNIKFKVASSGSFERYALSIVSNINGSEASQEVGFALTEQAQWNEIDINLEQYGVNLSNVSQIAVFGVYSEGVSAGQKVYLSDFVMYDQGIHAASLTKPSSDDKFVILTSSDEQADLRVDDNNFVNEGNITFSDWSTDSTLAGDVIYDGLNSFEATKGSGWGAVIALMGDIYGGVQSYEIDVAKYSTVNFKVAATGGFSEYTIAFVVDGAEHKMPLTVSANWTDVSIQIADIPLNLTKLTQIAIFGVEGNTGDKLYVTDLNIAK